MADAVDSDQPNVSKWERGVEPDTLTLAKLAKLAGVDVQDFIERPWKPVLRAVEQRALEPDQPVARAADAGETVEVIKLDLSFSMGPGTTIDDYIEESRLSFDLSYIRSFTRTAPARLRIASGVSPWATCQTISPLSRLMALMVE